MGRSISNHHLDLWVKRKGPVWARRRFAAPGLIDRVVNYNARQGTHRAAMEKTNTLALLKVVIKRLREEHALDPLWVALCSIGRDCPAAPRRAADIRKWKARVLRSRALTIEEIYDAHA